ncbi:MAG: hypothetical protein JST12_14525 [Armatimonadetes bacterium]|nr:hypothetical protein [Armatimonadota bacterium]
MKVFHENQLPWPPGRPLTDMRKPGRFQDSLDGALRRVEMEVSAFTEKGLIWRTRELTVYLDDVQIGVKGRFLSGRPPINPAVVVSFDLDDVPYTFAVDTYLTAIQNLCAIAATIKGLRDQERHGVLTMKQMLQSVEALPQISSASRKGWWEVLDLRRDSSRDSVEAKYRELLRSRHPDHGGTQQEFMELQEAIESARQVCK